MTAPPSSPAAQRAGRGLRVALAVSVAVNLGVVGLVAGVLLHGRPHRHDEMVRSVGFGPFTDALRPADRRALHDAFLKKVPDFHAERDQIRADSMAVLSALRATPYDPAAFDAAMATMQAHMAQRLAIGSGLMEDFIKGLSPADRKAFADRLDASLRRKSHSSETRSATAAPPPASGAASGN